MNKIYYDDKIFYIDIVTQRDFDNFENALIDYIAVYPEGDHDFLIKALNKYNNDIVNFMITKIISTDAILYLYKINNIKITEFSNLLFSSIAQRQAVSVNEIEKDILINVKPKMYIPPHKRNIIINDI
jgi:hypothetical protein